MSPKHNPLKLNPLQLRTLTLMQGLATLPDAAMREANGDVTITRFPQAHGDHFHLGNAVVAAKDATGLYNEAVWNALARKGLARTDWPHRITLTGEGLRYETGLAQEIFHASGH
jgi:folylpolyglutamate synthase/dihydropteroate synthase